MKALIGYTGFIGSNLKKKIRFQKLYNSINISKIRKHSFQEVYCAAPHGIKFWANRNPEKDKKIILKLIKNLRDVKCKKFIHISTLDVYPKKKSQLNENFNIYKSKTNYYGENRKLLEKFIINHFKDYLIIRLPALFASNLKKNALFDLLNNKEIRANKNSIFQWCNVEDLAKNINFLKKKKIKIVNLVSEPISLKSIIKFLGQRNLLKFPKLKFVKSKILKYNLFTSHGLFFKKKNYLFSKKEILEQIYDFAVKYNKFNKC
jgi:nucleoside-diphosphate-sugar epimerase